MPLLVSSLTPNCFDLEKAMLQIMLCISFLLVKRVKIWEEIQVDLFEFCEDVRQLVELCFINFQ